MKRQSQLSCFVAGDRNATADKNRDPHPFVGIERAGSPAVGAGRGGSLCFRIAISAVAIIAESSKMPSLSEQNAGMAVATRTIRHTFTLEAAEFDRDVECKLLPVAQL